MTRPRSDRRWPLIAVPALILALIIAAGVMLLNQASTATALRLAVEASYQRHLLLQQILSLHQDVETGSRGYVLTQDPVFLEPYNRAQPAIAPAFAQLDRLNGETVGHSRLAALRQLSTAKRNFVAETHQLVRHGQISDVLRRTREGQGKRLMDDLRREVARLQAAETAHLEQLSRQSEAARGRIRLTALGLLGLLLAILGAAACGMIRALQAREDALNDVEDLTRRRQAILNAAMDGIVILDASGTIESINATGARMFGYAVEELLQRDGGILSGMPVGQLALSLREMNLLDGEPGIVDEMMAQRKDGTPLATDIALSAASLSDGVHYVAIVRDMSERRRIDRMKAEFVANVSHELRTPLTSIAGSLSLLTAGAAGALPERAARLVTIAHSNADRLVRLINDILDIEKIDAGSMVFNNQPLQLSEVLEQAVEANRGYAERLNVRIELSAVPPDAQVWADPDRLMQVFANLISNAAKYSPTGEAIRILVQPGERSHRVSVCDKGPGISTEFADRIFQRFAQSDSSDSRLRGGTGLGLALVREIVTRFGGAISYDSEPGKGSDFHIDLPVAQSDNASQGLQRLLVCEQDLEMAGAITTTLTTHGLVCDVVNSASAAREALNRSSYCLILIDSRLPAGGGIALVRELRDQPRFANVPILMISADLGRGAIEVEALQIMEWLPKPVAQEAILAAVDRALSRVPPGRLPRVLHIEDDPDIVLVVGAALENKVELQSVSSIAAARAALAQGEIDLAILDLGLTDGSGLELLPDLAGAGDCPIPVIIFSAQDADPEVAARVQGYLTKSHMPIDRLVRTVVGLWHQRLEEKSR